MKEICLINKGENLYSIAFKLGINLENKEIHTENNYKSIVLHEGMGDVTIVRNYNPFFIKEFASETKLDDNLGGYTVVGDNIGCKKLIKKDIGYKYVVKPLETIDDIAKKFNIEKEKMQSL